MHAPDACSRCVLTLTHVTTPRSHSPSPQRSTRGVSHVGLADEVLLDGVLVPVLVPVAVGVHQDGRGVAGEGAAALDAGRSLRDASGGAAAAMGFNHAGPCVLECSAADWVFLLMTFLVACFLAMALLVAFFCTSLDPGRGTLKGATSQDSLCCRGRPGQAHCTILRPRGSG